MKKTLVLLFMLAVLLPSQAFAASSSAAQINKLYFEDYSAKVKEVKAAQKAYKAPVCSNVAALTSQYKQNTTKYNSLKKAKADKYTLSQAKTSLDQVKKNLSEVKKDCSSKTASMRKGSNDMLKDLDRYKAEMTKKMKAHLDGKGKMTSQEFDKFTDGVVSYINGRFKENLKMLNAPAAG
ncbi:hypothetical protein IAQ67_28700 (plasmid) [Paenibacillus peoriae]|uniref:Uncharacterized protein n=1 Tax=Paenibacillus peoriae TaxID=59893 RepID=A0A7H0YHD4_9BACL|nr:hypothetical protein [Paenibacillus peoriae]QNR70492.1 hypothetical protein IAQ67_28700 [Paenibacillus peoriae]